MSYTWMSSDLLDVPLEHLCVVGAVVALVAADGHPVLVRMLDVGTQVGHVGCPVAARVAHQVLALVVHRLVCVQQSPWAPCFSILF